MKKYMLPIMAASLALSACSRDRPTTPCEYTQHTIGTPVTTEYVSVIGEVKAVNSTSQGYESTAEVNLAVTIAQDERLITGSIAQRSRRKGSRAMHKASHYLRAVSQLTVMKENNQKITIEGKLKDNYIDIYRIKDSHSVLLKRDGDNCRND